ncbi:hypothetical protein AAY473_030100 [Plecturocebus cupreus]
MGPPNLPLGRQGSFCDVQAGLKLLGSSSPPALATQNTAIIGRATTPGPPHKLIEIAFLRGKPSVRPEKVLEGSRKPEQELAFLPNGP